MALNCTLILKYVLPVSSYVLRLFIVNGFTFKVQDSCSYMFNLRLDKLIDDSHLKKVLS